MFGTHTGQTHSMQQCMRAGMHLQLCMLALDCLPFLTGYLFPCR